jgi:hypothetical protein
MAQLRRELEADPARPRYLITEAGMGYRQESRMARSTRASTTTSSVSGSGAVKAPGPSLLVGVGRAGRPVAVCIGGLLSTDAGDGVGEDPGEWGEGVPAAHGPTNGERGQVGDGNETEGSVVTG